MNGSSDEIIHSASDDPEVERMPRREGEEVKVVTMARTMAHTAKKLLEQFRAVVPMTVYLFLFLFLVLRGKMGKAQMVSVCLGVICLVQGLTLFLEGLQWGLMPLSERIGGSLAFRLRLPAVLLICFLFGIGVTLAEPAIAALQIIGSLVKVERAPFLYIMLTSLSWGLVTVVAIGVGIAVVLGILRFYYSWGIKPLLILTTVPTILLSLVLHFIEDLRPIIGLAWDCGAITTGPVTVPVVLSLGIGVASSKTLLQGASNRNDKLTGFGLVTLASLVPVLTVQLFGLILFALYDKNTIITESDGRDRYETDKLWIEDTPYYEIILSARALVPLVFFLFIVLKVLIKEAVPRISLTDIIFPSSHSNGRDDADEGGLRVDATLGIETLHNDTLIEMRRIDLEMQLENSVNNKSNGDEKEEDDDNHNQIYYKEKIDHPDTGSFVDSSDKKNYDEEEEDNISEGMLATSDTYHSATNLIYFYLCVTLCGLILFNVGMTQGLTPLGAKTGSLIPTTFMQINDYEDSPLYGDFLGLLIAIAFAFLLGFGATYAEPALKVLGMQAEKISQGKLTKNLLVFSVCFGVAGGVVLGLIKITYNVPLVYIIVPAYLTTLALTLFTSEEITNIAWDCGGVTTGPVTVPLVLALGVALGNAVNAIEGFGILTLASVGPIISVLMVGLFVTKCEWLLNAAV